MKPIRKLSRVPTAKITAQLAAASAGRCEFRGCNNFLFEHPLTLRQGNFSQQAHIVAFSEDGPRGQDALRPSDINTIENLMLLCPVCHKEIDDNPGEYPRDLLESFKKEHEDRIRFQTNAGPEMRTSILVLKTKIGGSAVTITEREVRDAIAPKYPWNRQGTDIDLTTINYDTPNEYYSLAARQIDEQVAGLLTGGVSEGIPSHLSVFALAQIPLLVHLGRCLSNKIQVDLFQRHRDQDSPWKWPNDSNPVTYRTTTKQKGTSPGRVALLLSLSGGMDAAALPNEIDDSYTIYEIGLENTEPSPDFLRSAGDLSAFRREYRQFLGMLLQCHQPLDDLHVFPAIPAPIAVACGHDLLPKVHPTLVVYDRDRRSGGFIERLKVNEHDKK